MLAGSGSESESASPGSVPVSRRLGYTTKHASAIGDRGRSEGPYKRNIPIPNSAVREAYKGQVSEQCVLRNGGVGTAARLSQCKEMVATGEVVDACS